MLEIGELEVYMSRTRVVMLFLTQGYFSSYTCLRELLTALLLDEQRERDGRQGETRVQLILEDPVKRTSSLTHEQVGACRGGRQGQRPCGLTHQR
jgi:hypothetical protein